MNALQCTQKGLGQIDLIIGLGLGMAVLTMAMQAWGIHRQWLLERDVRTELQERTPFLHKMLMRLSRQAGSRALTWDGQAWQVEPAYAALPPGIGPTWVHARAIQASPALDPNCQNTRVWANQANAAPALIQDQFAWVDGQLKCF